MICESLLIAIKNYSGENKEYVRSQLISNNKRYTQFKEIFDTLNKNNEEIIVFDM